MIHFRGRTETFNSQLLFFFIKKKKTWLCSFVCCYGLHGRHTVDVGCVHFCVCQEQKKSVLLSCSVLPGFTSVCSEQLAVGMMLIANALLCLLTLSRPEKRECTDIEREAQQTGISKSAEKFKQLLNTHISFLSGFSQVRHLHVWLFWACWSERQRPVCWEQQVDESYLLMGHVWD